MFQYFQTKIWPRRENVSVPPYCILVQFKAKDSEIKDHKLCWVNFSKDFTTNNMKKTGLKRSVNFFFVDFNPIDTNGILDIHNI